MPDALPAAPEEITAAWLSARLEGTVTDVRVEPITDRTGLNGETARLHLAYTDASGAAGPATVIAKLPGVRSRGVAEYQRWYEREVSFYRELAPETPMRTPACLSAEITPQDDFVLLLEDLGHLRQGDQVAGSTAEEAWAALQAAAALHARWWEETPAPHAWLPSTTVGLDRAGPVQGAFARAWDAVRDAFPEGARAALDRGVEAYPELLAEVSRGPVTVCHGDYRLDNLFLDDASRPLEVVAFDWQFACRARGTYDVAYFLALDLEPDLLATHRDALLEGYLAALEARGVRGYGMAQCRRDYAVSLVLATAVFAIGAAGHQPSEASRVTHAVGLARLGAAVQAAGEAGWIAS